MIVKDRDKNTIRLCFLTKAAGDICQMTHVTTIELSQYLLNKEDSDMQGWL